MNAVIKQTIESWRHVTHYTHVPRNAKEHEEQLQFVDGLMKWCRKYPKDKDAASLLRVMAKNIEAYETRNYPPEKLSPVEILKLLMEEHGLGQKDLPEIGSQSLVSKILSGERQLTLEHVRQLAKRFGVSPSVFC